MTTLTTHDPFVLMDRIEQLESALREIAGLTQYTSDEPQTIALAALGVKKMDLNKDTVLAACKEILGEEVVDRRMTVMFTPLPNLVTDASLKAFVENRETIPDNAVDIVRQALDAYNTRGYL
jgi:hypothetical protein